MQLTLDIPDAAHLTKADAQIMLAVKLFETKKLPLGKAAEVAGLSYRAFHELLIKYDVPIVTMTEDDVRMEVANAQKHL
jgi:predicted HTH domain antitoxin